MFENINILFISAKHDDINAVIKYIKIDKKNVAIASDEKEAIALFDAMSPSVLFFYNSMVEHSQALYLKMHEHSKLISQVKHHSILFCDHSDFEVAYNKCNQDIFYDYIIMPPRLDKLRINLTIKRALESIKQEECLSKEDELSRVSKSIGECGDDINDSIKNTQTMSIVCDASLNDLSTNIKDNIKHNSTLTSLNQTNFSTKIDSIISAAVDESIDASKVKIQSVINTHTSNLSTNQNKLSNSLSELEKVATSRSTKVLIIEDNELYGEMVCTMLEQANDYTVKHVTSVQQGLVAFVCDRPDVILLDFELGDGDANTFLEKITELPKTKDIPVIMLTSHTTSDVYTTTSMLGAKGFIRKPASKELIIAQIKKILL